MTKIFGVAVGLPPIIALPLLVGLALLLCALVYLAVSAAMRHLSDDFDRIVKLVRRYTITLLLAGAAYAVLASTLVGTGEGALVNRIAPIVLGAIAIIGAAHVAILSLTTFMRRSASLAPLASPVGTVSKIAAAVVGTVLLLDNLGVSLTAVWTTLGVGSVAIALALNDTLSNLFAGIYIVADRLVKEGDYVRLESGEEGYVRKVGWRSVRFEMLSSDEVVVPNAKLASQTLTNLSKPRARSTAPISVGVAYESDLDRVEEILAETAASLSNFDGFDTKRSASVRIDEFADSSINFIVYVPVTAYVKRRAVQTELFKRIKRRFDAEGISIPFPQRVIQVMK